MAYRAVYMYHTIQSDIQSITFIIQYGRHSEMCVCKHWSEVNYTLGVARQVLGIPISIITWGWWIQPLVVCSKSQLFILIILRMQTIYYACMKFIWKVSQKYLAFEHTGGLIRQCTAFINILRRMPHNSRSRYIYT